MEVKMAKHELWHLKQMQSLPLEAKISMTQYRIRQWVDEYGEDGVYISFSGGKDSTVLLDIVRKMFPSIPAVFINTGLEYPSVREFAESKENVTVIRPSMNFREVIRKYGYPVISKEVSGAVYEGKKYLDELHKMRTISTDRQTDRQTLKYAYRIADFLGIDRRINPQNEDYQNLIKGIIPSKPARMKMLLGEYKDKEGRKSHFNKEKWQFLLYAPFNISDRCCNVMKKAPAHNYQRKMKRQPFIATLAEESRLRTSNWLRRGCNAFDGKYPRSNPMSFWTEQDILSYIHNNKIDIASAYGKVVVKNDGIDGQININDYLGDYRYCQYQTTGQNRTGCIFCMFGITKDKDRFIRLYEQEPKLCDYVLRGGRFEDGVWQPTNDGLGYWFVIEWINIHGNLEIRYPDKWKYLEEYQTSETEKYLCQSAE